MTYENALSKKLWKLAKSDFYIEKEEQSDTFAVELKGGIIFIVWKDEDNHIDSYCSN